jgi:ubiquinone/menaquinone biosynthesis C-methylase UbiE
MTKYRIYYDDLNKKYYTTYGELTNKGLIEMFKNIDTRDKTFYDLGSGKGSVVINAINNYPELKKAIGIEYVKERHDEAIKRKYEMRNSDKINFMQGDFTSNDFNISDADLIYISNLCLSEETNKEIAEKINKEVKSGTYVFSSKQIPLKNVSKCYQTKVNQTWKEGSNIYVNKLL